MDECVDRSKVSILNLDAATRLKPQNPAVAGNTVYLGVGRWWVGAN